jgi:hypothetical protein
MLATASFLSLYAVNWSDTSMKMDRVLHGTGEGCRR